MSRFKESSIKKMTKRLCLIAMLIAITALLAIFFTFRVGNAIKIPMKFISVFITGFYFGPLVAGLVCMTGDILNVILVPSGAWLPLLSLGEFVFGFILGACFHSKNRTTEAYIPKLALSSALCFLLDMFFSTWVLVSAGYFPGFTIAFEFRLAAGIIKICVQIIILIALRNILPRLTLAIEKVLK